MMQNYSPRARLIMGVVLAPFVGAAAGSVVTALTAPLMSPDQTGWGSVPVLLLMFLFGSFYVGATVGIAASLVLGLPAHALVSRLGLVSVWPYLACGAAAGAAVCWGWFAVMSAQNDLPDTPVLLIALFTGATSALTFWLIRRPDRNEPNPPTSPS